MCGIAGLLGKSVSDARLAAEMATALIHRGPDGFGHWNDTDSGIALSHRRLSILELSIAGHQPMISHCKRYAMSFNGEIYNHQELRDELARDGNKFDWRGHCDSETLLACITAYGLEQALPRLVGMFAISIFDRRDRKLHLAIDRMGEKPIYYGWGPDGFAFASELKAFTVLPGFSKKLCDLAIKQFVSFGFIAAPLSIYRDYYKLEPGSHLTITIEAADESPCDAPMAPSLAPGFSLKKYWQLSDVARSGIENPITSRVEAERLIHEQLRSTIARQAQADVTVGSFLSGGCDSLLITAMLNEVVPTRLLTFTLGVEGHAGDESGAAREVSEHFGTSHHELMVSGKDAESVIAQLPAAYDEPFADASQLPTMLLTALASKHVKVALSGDGGDELFGGYDRYVEAARLWPVLARIPDPLRRAGGQAMDSLGGLTNWLARQRSDCARMQGRWEKLATILQNSRNPSDLYDPIMRIWPSHGADQILPPSSHRINDIDNDLDVVQAMMLADQKVFLPHDILCKVDRAAMASSLETRIPLLDHRIVELAWRLPSTWKADGKTCKGILRNVARQYAPAHFIDRPKAGFTIPIGEYLRTDLRDWAEDLLDPASLADHFDPEPILRRWKQHVAGERDWFQSLWVILMFESWRRHNFSNDHASSLSDHAKQIRSS